MNTLVYWFLSFREGGIGRQEVDNLKEFRGNSDYILRLKKTSLYLFSLSYLEFICSANPVELWFETVVIDNFLCKLIRTKHLYIHTNL